MAFDARVVSNIGVLAAIVQAGSFARAGDALGLTRSGVSRAVSRLEKQLGVRLIDRTTRAVALTDEGRSLYAQIAPLLSGIEDAVSIASSSSTSVRGRLRINADAFFSRLILAPLIPEFLALFPNLSLELVARDQLGDLVAEGFDLAMRFGMPPESSLVTRKILDTRMVTVASPAYLKAHGRPAAPEDLRAHACIQVRNSLTGDPLERWSFWRDGKTVQITTAGRLTVTEFGTMLSACLEGVGIARIKGLGVRQFIEEGALVELLPEWLGENFPLRVYYPSRQRPAAKVRAFIDFIQSRLAKPASRARQAATI